MSEEEKFSPRNSMRMLRGTDVKRAPEGFVIDGVDSIDLLELYRALPSVHNALHVDDKILVMGLLGEIRLATVNAVGVDETGCLRATASDEWTLLFLRFGDDEREAWACVLLMGKECARLLE
jgi:hypothetical protein